MKDEKKSAGYNDLTTGMKDESVDGDESHLESMVGEGHRQQPVALSNRRARSKSPAILHSAAGAAAEAALISPRCAIACPSLQRLHDVAAALSVALRLRPRLRALSACTALSISLFAALCGGGRRGFFRDLAMF